MFEPAVVLERTSGDEGDGQDVDAQANQTVHRATEHESFRVLAVIKEKDVSGDVPWDHPKRNVLLALRVAEDRGAVLVVREVSRLWRGAPAEGVLLIEKNVPNLSVLGKPIWKRRGGQWVDESDSAVLIRFIELWDSWREKRKIQERTQLVMDEIKADRRKTRSGKPPGRPVVEIEEAHLVEARRVLADGQPMAEAHRVVLRLRGHEAAKDPRTKAARYVSKAKLGEALGIYVPSSVRKANASETQGAPARDLSDGEGSLADGAANGVGGADVA